MVEEKKLQLLATRRDIEDAATYTKVGYKHGFPIEKGVILNEEYLLKHKKEIGDTF